MFSTSSTTTVPLTASADLVRALSLQDSAVRIELREVRLLERAGELTAYQARLLRDAAQITSDARTARWRAVRTVRPVSTLDLEAWHGDRDDEVGAPPRDPLEVRFAACHAHPPPPATAASGEGPGRCSRGQRHSRFVLTP